MEVTNKKNVFLSHGFVSFNCGNLYESNGNDGDSNVFQHTHQVLNFLIEKTGFSTPSTVLLKRFSRYASVEKFVRKVVGTT